MLMFRNGNMHVDDAIYNNAKTALVDAFLQRQKVSLGLYSIDVHLPIIQNTYIL
jgi:hypothetical protein